MKQPYNRREELVEIAKEVPNIAAKQEGGDPEAEQCMDHPSDILDYFMPKADVLKTGLWKNSKGITLKNMSRSIKRPMP